MTAHMEDKMGTLTGWHFAADRLRDGRPLPKKGERITHDGPCVPCESGLHFSQKALDALRYAPDWNVARVMGPDDAIPHGNPEDKLCGAWRENLTDYVNARDVILAWAFSEADIAVRVHSVNALRAAGLNDEADKLAALPKIVSVETAEQARAAAWAAAWASGDAAWAAAGASGAAARDAAWAAARAAALNASNARLESALLALFEKEAS